MKTKISRQELRSILLTREETDISRPSTLPENIYFDFPNPYNLIFTVYYTLAKGTSVHKDFTNPTQAFNKWLKTPMRRNSTPFISVKPPNSDSFPHHFHAQGLPFQIGLRYIEYLEKIEEWVKFLEDAHPDDLQ